MATVIKPFGITDDRYVTHFYKVGDELKPEHAGHPYAIHHTEPEPEKPTVMEPPDKTLSIKKTPKE